MPIQNPDEMGRVASVRERNLKSLCKGKDVNNSNEIAMWCLAGLGSCSGHLIYACRQGTQQQLYTPAIEKRAPGSNNQ